MFYRYKTVCKISKIKIKRKGNYRRKCWQTPNILTPPGCLNYQNISPLPTHGHCHCGQSKIPVVSSCEYWGAVVMKSRVFRSFHCKPFWNRVFGWVQSCTFACCPFKTRRPYAPRVKVSTISRALDPWGEDRKTTLCSTFE